VDIGTFFVERAIIHQIPQAKMDQKSEIPPVLAEGDSELDDRRKSYFQKRIRRSLQNSFSAERDGDEQSPVPSHVLEYFQAVDDGTDRFVEVSQAIARHLHASQGGISPSGLLAVVEGTIGTGSSIGKCLTVLKLEMEQGVHIELVEVNGKKVFAINLEEVTLTDSTRVFKASLFPRAADLDSMTAIVSDDQLDSSTVGREVAQYFLKTFLGCRLSDSPRIATKRYTEIATTYFNGLEDDEKKLRYEGALNADLFSQIPTINPQTFAKNHLDKEDRDGFLAHFKQGDGRVGLIEKDVDLIRSREKRTWVELQNGVRLTGPPAEVDLVMTAIRGATTADGVPVVNAKIKKVR